MFMTFAEYLSQKEGLLMPDRPAVPGLPKINSTPFTNAHRRRHAAKPGPVLPKIPQPSHSLKSPYLSKR